MAGKRSIFEEVPAPVPRAAPAPRGGMIGGGAAASPRAMRLWLGILFALVVAMIAVGGLTRLTDSGLAITEWRPVTGALPPLDEADWQRAFALYQQSPEFRLQNRLMTLDEFQSLYWWEWGHRQLGRLIGLVWAAGFAGLALARRIPPGWAGRLWLLGGLGAAQGAIGWWMVASGLEGRMVDVASYRLAIHLGLAFLILGRIAWHLLDLGRDGAGLLQARRRREPPLVRAATLLAALAFLQILLGALVAGIDAGRGYIDWPLMGGEILPSEAFAYRPRWSNLFENPALVQFDHRLAGYLVVAVAVWAWARGRRSVHAATRGAFALVLAAAAAQAVLGIVTVIQAAPLGLGLAHQIGAVALWVVILRARHRALYPVVQSLRSPG